MSYEDYARTSANYDSTRRPIGLPILLGCFASAGRSLSDLTVLDAGCGTGSFALALLPWVDRIVGVDACREMIQEAAMKIASAHISPDRFTLKHGHLEDLPFADGEFDAAMVNQVLHHLTEQRPGELARHRMVFREFNRVIRDGGTIVINTCTHAQIDDGWWYRELFPHAFARLKQKVIPLGDLCALLHECGFAHQQNVVPTDALFQGESYFDGRGPLNQAWRDGDSIFSLATHQELQDGCCRIRRMDRAGTLDDFVRKHDARRRDIGQTTFVHAVKRTVD